MDPCWPVIKPTVSSVLADSLATCLIPVFFFSPQFPKRAREIKLWLEKDGLEKTGEMHPTRVLLCTLNKNGDAVSGSHLLFWHERVCVSACVCVCVCVCVFIPCCGYYRGEDVSRSTPVQLPGIRANSHSTAREKKKKKKKKNRQISW